VAQGHDVTLFASGDSITQAELVPCCTQALRLTPGVVDPIPYYMLMLDKVRRMASEFDILHFHHDQFHFPIFTGWRTHGDDAARPSGLPDLNSSMLASRTCRGVDLECAARADPGCQFVTTVRMGCGSAPRLHA